MGRPSRTLKQVAEELLAKATPNGECLECHLSTNGGGYSKTYYGNAHRVVWKGLKGPTDKWVLHTCDNRRCINLDHLFLGTCQDNVDDMIAKGRKVIASQHRYINEEQRIEINQLYNDGYRIVDLANLYGVSESTISRNIGERYDHSK